MRKIIKKNWIGMRKKYLQVISNAAVRMRTLIDDLLAYARIGQKREVVEVDCNELIRDIKTDLAHLISEANASIEAGQLPTVKAFKTDLTLLFQNLITNALKFRKEKHSPSNKNFGKKKEETLGIFSTG